MSIFLNREQSELQTYSLRQVLHDYALLRRITLEYLETDGQLSKDRRNLIIEVFDMFTSQAGGEFAEDKSQLERDGRIVAEKMSEELAAQNVTRERYMAMVSHDLRNPIGAAKMAAETIEMELEDGTGYRKLFEILYRSLDRAEQILNDLLDVNRIKSLGAIPLKISHLNLEALASGLVADGFGEESGRIRLKISGDPLGYWDGSALKRLLQNLISNALKYGDPEKQITIRITRHVDMILLNVHNWGEAIPLKDQASIFEPYFRSGEDLNSSKKGWGLGLALVKGVAESHGGKVAVESSLGFGTTVSVHLPSDARPRC
jgi:signal transduction histidine kinase